MITKYNARFAISDMNTDRHGSYIQKYLEKEVNYLLASSVNQLNEVDFEKVYIHNLDMEEILSQYLIHTPSNSTCIVTGLTGSGKTMLVRHVFGLHGIKPHIEGTSLIIPFDFDNALYSGVKRLFTRMIRAAGDCLLENFPDLHHIDDHSDDFYKFIKDRRNDLLYDIEAYPSPGKQEQLSALCQHNTFAFYASAFKFYLSQRDVCPIDNVILVIDDLEGIRLDSHEKEGLPRELLPIKITLELIECLQNADRQKNAWSLNTIICCRHFVSRLMRSTPYNFSKSYTQCLESYSLCSQYDLRESPSIMEIIEKRYEAIPASNRQSGSKWTVAMGVVRELIERVDSNIGPLVLDLTLKNIREALYKIKQIVFNKLWVQRNYVMDHPGAFKITDIRQYSTSSASLIRALGMNESRVYHSQESIIPNLLYNELNGHLELFPLLTLKYFLEFANYGEMSWDNSIRISYFMDDQKELFQSEKYKRNFQTSLAYLIEHRLLLRSYDQDQRDGNDLNKKDASSIEYVYVPSRSIALWNLLGEKSVLFEMYLDDIWMDNAGRSRNKAQFRGFDSENFGMCLEYLSILISVESDIYSQAVNVQGNGQMFCNIFGATPICNQLLKGLRNSLNLYYHGEYEREPDLVNIWRYKIEELQRACNQIYRK